MDERSDSVIHRSRPKLRIDQPEELCWVIRRWRCSFTGTLTIDWKLAKREVGGNGVTGRVFLNGSQLDLASIAGNDLVGTNRSLVVANARAGDLLDFALSPVGVTATSDDTLDGASLGDALAGLGDESLVLR